MSLPGERTRALLKTRRFLFDLLDHKKTPKVPKYIRKMAASCLKHYPFDVYIEMVAQGAPDIFGSLDLLEAQEYYTKIRGKRAYERK